MWKKYFETSQGTTLHLFEIDKYSEWHKTCVNKFLQEFPNPTICDQIYLVTNSVFSILSSFSKLKIHFYFIYF